MKNLLLTAFFLLFFASFSVAQTLFSAKVYDGINFMPVAGANIYNLSSGKFAFSDKNGVFSIIVSPSDTLVISKSIYRQSVIVATDDILKKTNEVFFLYCRAIVLKEVSVYGLNPNYEIFKHEVVNMNMPDYYDNIVSKPTKLDIQNAEYMNTAPNILKNTKVAHPITALYEAFSPRMKMKRLYNEMVQYENELDNVQSKFNRELVSELTGLQGDELMEFMVYCHFSYYDLIRSSREQIINSIKNKFTEYEYFKVLEDE
ncbi:MAG: hypothetical protein IJT51_05505 [Bacteroidales bacterium]|nr:hypothetical protein [Bacteroidales bacterium]